MNIAVMKVLTGLFAGVTILYIAVYWLRLGRVWDNIYGWTSKDSRPVWFWSELISVFVIAICLIAKYLVQLRAILLS